MDQGRHKLLLGAIALVAALAAVLIWTRPTVEPEATSAAPVPPPDAIPAPAAVPVPAPAPAAVPEPVPAPVGQERGLPGTWVDVAAASGKTEGPVIVGLAGRGDTAGHFSALAGRLAPDLPWRVLQGTLPFRDGTAWFDADTPDGGRQGVLAAIDHVDAHVRSFRGRRVGLVGFSQGCMLAAHYAAAHPDAVQAVLCIGGTLLFPPEAPATGPKPRFLFVHGTDDQMVPFAAARGAIQQLENRGFHTEIIEHPDGHVVPEAELERMGAWLRKTLEAP